MSTNVSNFVYVQIVYKLFACLYTFKSAPLRNASLREKVARIQNPSFCIRFEFYVYVKKCASTKWCLYVEKTPTDDHGQVSSNYTHQKKKKKHPGVKVEHTQNMIGQQSNP